MRLLRSVAVEEISPAELAVLLVALEGPRRKGDARARLARAQAARLVGRLAAPARQLEEIIQEGADPRPPGDAHGTLGAVHRAQGRLDEALVHKEAPPGLAKG